MTTSALRQRPGPASQVRKLDVAADTTNPALDPKIGHPSGEAKYGRFRSLLRAFTFSLYFGSGILTYALSSVFLLPEFEFSQI